MNLTTYKLGEKWHTKADNVSPGAALARIVADTREDAEARALARAKELLSRTKRHDGLSGASHVRLKGAGDFAHVSL